MAARATIRRRDRPTGFRRFLAALAGVLAVIVLSLTPPAVAAPAAPDGAGPFLAVNPADPDSEPVSGALPPDSTATVEDAATEGLLPQAPRLARAMIAGRPPLPRIETGSTRSVTPPRRPPRASVAT
jgi:hypothetical protein